MELILMWMPMQGIKFRDFMSSVVCASNRNGSPASSSAKQFFPLFSFALAGLPFLFEAQTTLDVYYDLDKQQHLNYE